MYTCINVLSSPFKGATLSRIKRLLLERKIYRGVKEIKNATPGQAILGIDLVVTLDAQTVFLQIQPGYKWAAVTRKFTLANVAIIVANNQTPDGLLIKKLTEGLDYFRV